MSLYDMLVTSIDGESVDLNQYRGKVLLIVNTASKCGFTPQYKGLEALYQTYGEKGLVVLGFPCDQFGNQEPGKSDEIKGFCELNYGVTFPLFEKIDVRGPEAHPLFKYLVREKPGLLKKDIQWNFTKFLVDRNGKVVARYAPTTPPEKLVQKIEKLL